MTVSHTNEIPNSSILGPKQKFPCAGVPEEIILILRRCDNVIHIAETSVIWIW
jgi:hypothetical protein